MNTSTVGESQFEKRQSKMRAEKERLDLSGGTDLNTSLNTSNINQDNRSRMSGGQNLILSTMMATNMGGDGMNLMVDLTANQKKKVEKSLLKDRVESQIDLKKVLRQQLDDHNRRLKSLYDEKKGEGEKIMADRERRKVEKLTE